MRHIGEPGRPLSFFQAGGAHNRESAQAGRHERSKAEQSGV